MKHLASMNRAEVIASKVLSALPQRELGSQVSTSDLCAKHAAQLYVGVLDDGVLGRMEFDRNSKPVITVAVMDRTRQRAVAAHLLSHWIDGKHSRDMVYEYTSAEGTCHKRVSSQAETDAHALSMHLLMPQSEAALILSAQPATRGANRQQAAAVSGRALAHAFDVTVFDAVIFIGANPVLHDIVHAGDSNYFEREVRAIRERALAHA